MADYVPLPGGAKIRFALPSREGLIEAGNSLKDVLTKPTFFKLYWALNWSTVFLVGAVITSIEPSISYIDGMYMGASAFGQVGLTALDLAEVNYAINIVLCLTILLGSNIIQTILPLVLRRHFFDPEKASRLDLLEYKAIGKLIPVVLCFYFGLQMFAFVILSFWASNDVESLAVLTRNNNSPLGWAAMMSISAFHSNGLCPISNNMVSFYQKPLPLLLLSFLTVVGETMYPVVLRFLVWTLSLFSTGHDRLAYRYLLKNSRRVYTHLFPRMETYWLLIVAIAINTIEFLFFVVINWNSLAFNYMNPSEKVLGAFFMATTTRKSGFNVIDITQLDVGMLSFYIGAMYLSTAPVTAAVRSSSGRFRSSIYVQAKALLTQDSLWLFAIFVAIGTIESARVKTDPNFTVFGIIFELISAYGTVGLSLGYPGTVTSFSAVWTPLSKLLLVCAMVIGRLRGFPDDDEIAIRVHQEATHEGLSGIRSTAAVRPENTRMPHGLHSKVAAAASKRRDHSKFADMDLNMLMESLQRLIRLNEAKGQQRPESPAATALKFMPQEHAQSHPFQPVSAVSVHLEPIPPASHSIDSHAIDINDNPPEVINSSSPSNDVISDAEQPLPPDWVSFPHQSIEEIADEIDLVQLAVRERLAKTESRKENAEVVVVDDEEEDESEGIRRVSRVPGRKNFNPLGRMASMPKINTHRLDK